MRSCDRLREACSDVSVKIMSDVVIRVEGLSKKFKIGSSQPYHRLSEMLTGLGRAALRTPLRLVRSTRNQGASTAEQGQHPDEFWALRDINFDVRQGEVVGIIGRNGAGKSTLLKILSRITEPTEGCFGVKGRVGSLLEVGTGFHPELTGRENIYLSGTILGMTRAEIKTKFDEIVDFSGVEQFLDTPVKRYSSGMQVRLGFAVAAHLDPEILIVDEVLAVGDAEFQKKCLGKMSDVSSSGRTILFVSHNMAAVSALCGRCLLLIDGNVDCDADVDKVVSKYLNNAFANIITGDLANHPGRSQHLTPLLCYFEMETDHGVLNMGDNVRFRLHYDFPEPILSPQFCVLFVNDMGVTAFTLISSYQENNIPDKLCGKGEVACIIEELPLLPGRYSITLKLWQPGQKLDEIEHAYSFIVEWNDLKTEQIQWSSSLGAVYVEATWSYHKDGNF